MSVVEKPATIRLVRRVLEPERPPDLVHHFLFVRVGNNVLLETCYFDLAELKTAVDKSRETDTEADATLFIGRRFHMNPDALRQLVEAGTELLAALNAPAEHGVTK